MKKKLALSRVTFRLQIVPVNLHAGPYSFNGEENSVIDSGVLSGVLCSVLLAVAGVRERAHEGAQPAGGVGATVGGAEIARGFMVNGKHGPGAAGATSARFAASRIPRPQIISGSINCIAPRNSPRTSARSPGEPSTSARRCKSRAASTKLGG